MACCEAKRRDTRRRLGGSHADRSATHNHPAPWHLPCWQEGQPRRRRRRCWRCGALAAPAGSCCFHFMALCCVHCCKCTGIGLAQRGSSVASWAPLPVAAAVVAGTIPQRRLAPPAARPPQNRHRVLQPSYLDILATGATLCAALEPSQKSRGLALVVRYRCTSSPAFHHGMGGPILTRLTGLLAWLPPFPRPAGGCGHSGSQGEAG